MKPNQYINKAKKVMRKIKTIKIEFVVTKKKGQACVSGFID